MTIKLHRDQFRWTNGRGLDRKPILYSQKANTYGLGKKEHNADQWWATAFDNQLKSLDVSNSSSGVTVTQTKTNATPLGMAITSRYYIKFVSGGILKGDIEEARAVAAAAAVTATEIEANKACSKDRKEKKKKEKRSRNSRELSSSEGRQRTEKKGKKKATDTRDGRKDKRRLKRLLEKEMASLQTQPAGAQ